MRCVMNCVVDDGGRAGDGELSRLQNLLRSGQHDAEKNC